MQVIDDEEVESELRLEAVQVAGDLAHAELGLEADLVVWGVAGGGLEGEAAIGGVQLAEAEAVGAAILEASRTMATVQQQAYHDPLTGLANRALFEDAFARQLASSERSGNPFAVLAIDLDEFKAVNDQQGHAAGDTVLRIAAERITGTVRASDVPARMGGDEFSVLLTDADRDDAVQTAERLVAALSQPYPDIKIAVSASVGIAVYQAEENRVDLLDAADRALYQAKGAGKKRAVLDAESDPAD